MKRPQFTPERSCLFVVALSGLIIGALLFSSLIRSVGNISSFGLCSFASAKARAAAEYAATPTQLQSILHYATSKIVPQQSLAEISVTFDVLKTRSPCNFLVFGLGFDSLMWTSLNPHGTTLFLEEDPKWVRTIVKNTPTLNAHTVQYLTQLKEADSLLKTYRSEPLCSPSKAYLRGNYKCRKYLVKAVGRLWHFEIPPAANVSQSDDRLRVNGVDSLAPRLLGEPGLLSGVVLDDSSLMQRLVKTMDR
ncbi:hypothetical protein D5086_000511 [Populus alba]|uniref:Uncharacterized protein n=1 Tax=Populus alba TaxID=43335 RepID=A0ACC4CW41_POPAL